MDPALIEPAHHAAHQGDSVRAPARHAVRSRPHRRDRPPPRHSGHRGRCVRQRQRDSVGWPVGEDRQAARRHRLLLVSPAQGHHHRRRRHDHDGESRSSIAKFRLWRQHSMSVPDTVRHGAREVIFESYPEVGFNFRMTDMQAAVGRVQLTRLASIVEERRRIAQDYATRLAAIDGRHRRRSSRRWARTNWQSYCVELRDVVRSAGGDAADARRWRLDAARRDELAPGAAVPVRRPIATGCRAASARSNAASSCRCCRR